MGLHGARMPRVGKFARPPALQLQYGAEVTGHHVKPTAQSQSLANESRFQQHFASGDADILLGEAMVYRIIYIVKLPMRPLKKIGMNVRGMGHISRDVVVKMSGKRSCIKRVGTAIAVDTIVHKGIGGISQQNGGRAVGQPQAVQQVVVGRTAIGTQASRQGADIDEIVRLQNQHERFGTVGSDARLQQIHVLTDGEEGIKRAELRRVHTKQSRRRLANEILGTGLGDNPA